ncbi:hypothetical protein A8135_03070 [Legionella jamestowniensis]|uniref:Uncharacterized protein n=1 Tax=Legionella jamestowniensis TaxID=455 RepID=A0ABX2XX17_9GAMM|nr:hypothetical protein [Legionella jamestowniensis]OCH97471.1 hypothetical protein A8135_03070 [Legionella jamestowniensis]
MPKVALRSLQDLRQAGDLIYRSSKLNPNDLQDNCIYLDRIETTVKGTGFGTAAMRYIINESFARGYEGNLKTDSSWDSHLFYLALGLIPEERQVPYVQNKYGIPADDSLAIVVDFFEKHEGENGEELKSALQELLEDNDYLLDEIAVILQKEGKIERKQSANIDDLLKNREFLSEISYATSSYLHDQFIPSLLHILEKNIGKKSVETNTSSLNAVMMVLSDEGKKRWKKALDNESEFKTFKQFEQLHPYMDNAQKEKLQSILAKNATFKQQAPQLFFSQLQQEQKEEEPAPTNQAVFNPNQH